MVVGDARNRAADTVRSGPGHARALSESEHPMGAHDFWNTSKNADVQKAYDELVSNALVEDGRDPYNGTISTTRGFVVASRTPVPAKLAEALALRRFENNELVKWGPAEARAVGVYAKTATKKVVVEIAMDANGHGAISIDDVAKAAGVSPERIAEYTVRGSKIKHRTAVSPPTTYTRRWEVDRRTYATKAEAVKAAKALIEQRITEVQTNNRGTLWTHAITVKPVLVTERHVSVVPQITSWKATVEVQIGKGEIAFDHWLFYGLAAS